MFDFLVRFAQIGEQAQVILAHDAAREEPGADTEELVELHELAVADENLVVADERLDQPLVLVEHLGREKALTIVLLLAAAIAGLAGEEIGQVAIGLEEVI